MTSNFNFGSIAQSYDLYYLTAVGQMVDRLEKACIDRLLPVAVDGQTLVEIGSGTGHWSAHFAGRGYRVTGVDISHEMVDVARSKLIKNAVFMVADAISTGFDDDSFDIAAAIALLEFLPDPESALREMVRIVKPGGLLIFGLLHEDSWMGAHKWEHPIYSLAHFFRIRDVESLLGWYGQVTIEQCLFSTISEDSVEIADKVEEMGRENNWTNGNFLVARVKL
jgi:ubiquinone/menaquinone biosynthesis C-methylase UbiE